MAAQVTVLIAEYHYLDRPAYEEEAGERGARAVTVDGDGCAREAYPGRGLPRSSRGRRGRLVKDAEATGLGALGLPTLCLTGRTGP